MLFPIPPKELAPLQHPADPCAKDGRRSTTMPAPSFPPSTGIVDLCPPTHLIRRGEELHERGKASFLHNQFRIHEAEIRHGTSSCNQDRLSTSRPLYPVARHGLVSQRVCILRLQKPPTSRLHFWARPVVTKPGADPLMTERHFECFSLDFSRLPSASSFKVQHAEATDRNEDEGISAHPHHRLCRIGFPSAVWAWAWCSPWPLELSQGMLGQGVRGLLVDDGVGCLCATPDKGSRGQGVHRHIVQAFQSAQETDRSHHGVDRVQLA